SVSDADGGSNTGMKPGASGSVAYYPVNPVASAGSATLGTRALTSGTGFIGAAGTVSSTATTFRTNTPAAGGDSLFTISTSVDEVFVNTTVDDGTTEYQFDTSSSNSVYIDDTRFASAFGTGGTQALGSSSGFSNVTTVGYFATGKDNTSGFDLCSACTYLTWGFWGADMASPTSTAIHMGTWVTGTATSVSEMVSAFGKSATYTGNVIGSVINASAHTVETGSVSVGVTFGSSTYDVTDLTMNFGGQTFTGSSSFVVQTDNYSVSATSSGGRSLDATGYFFGSPSVSGNPPPETAGDFAITGTDYKAGGVFGASCTTGC
ncbi:MAG: hypothetical protein HOL85_14395, partial [Rhodospirillaceae bacterium]|nr:hypothetical protein [Rhodospirillaceae bacterium]